MVIPSISSDETSTLILSRNSTFASDQLVSLLFQFLFLFPILVPLLPLVLLLVLLLHIPSSLPLLRVLSYTLEPPRLAFSLLY